MPIYDEDSTVRHQIGKVYDNDGTTNHQIGKVYDNDGTANHLIYTAEETRSDLSASVSNYYEYKTTHSAKSSAAWDLIGFGSVSFSWSLTTDMSWPNANGVKSTTTVYLYLADGTTILVGSKTGELFGAGDKYTASGTKTVDLSSYTDAQLADVKLYITLGSMVAGSPISGSDRHNASVSITGAIAS